MIDKNYLYYIFDFCVFASECIGLTKPITVLLVDKNYSDIGSTGGYVVDKFLIKAMYEGRALVDILRSIAHELQHQKQNELDQIPPNPQNIGGRLENEANIICGILIKLYVNLKNSKHIYKM